MIMTLLASVVIIVFLVLLALFNLLASGKEKTTLRAGSRNDLEHLQAMVYATAIDNVSHEIAYENDRAEMHNKLSTLLWQSIIEQEKEVEFAISDEQREELRQNLLDEMLGFGPIQRFLADPGVSEISVSGYDQITIIRNGQSETTAVKFRNAEHLKQIVERMTSPFELQLDRQNPSVTLHLPDGSEVTIVLSPTPDSLPTLHVKK